MISPLIPMLAVTGKPSYDDIYRFLCSLKDGDIEQVLVYPRSGCEIEYLSEEWFDTVGYFISAADSLDMSIWLYDDFNWPSGDAGGRITANADFRLRAISTKGADIGQISTKSTHNSGLFGEKYFPDLLSHDAVDYFIKCTHEEYYKRFGKYFGGTIKGIFTDEPSIGYCCHHSYIPYYDRLASDYFEAYHRDFYKDMKESYPDFYKNAMTVISARFKDSYVDRLVSWCKSHDILMTGHFMCDHNPFYATSHAGNLAKNLRSFSLPGIDDIYTSFDDICEMTLLGTAEYASGENGAMAELFALGPCDMSYAKKRAMLYLCACHKINHYFLAISHLDMRGNLLVKDFFNTFSQDQPDFLGMKELSQASRIAAHIAAKDYTPDVYVRYPFDISAKNVSICVDTEEFLGIINELTKNQIQWKFIYDEENGKIPVIELDEQLHPTLLGQPYHISQLQKELTVTHKDGATPSGIFVRKFNDGSYIVINLFSSESEFLIDKRLVKLEKYDVYFSDQEIKEKNSIELFPRFNITYKNPNIIRAMYINSQPCAQVICNCDTKIILAVRNGAVVCLNGEKVEASATADALPKGMRCLYTCTEPITLKKGTHVLKATDDFKYMPSVLLIGSFNAQSISNQSCHVVIDKRAELYSLNTPLYDYGAIELSAKIFIPHNATEIELLGTDLYTEIYLDGILLGQRSFMPYSLALPPDLCGKDVMLKIVQYSSIAPIFGDVDYWDKATESCGWRGTPSTDRKSFGFSRILLKLK